MLLILAIFSLFSCVSVTSRRPSASTNSCSIDENYPRLFNVIENNSKQITVQLGSFANFFKFSDSTYAFKVIFKGSKENNNQQQVVISEGRISENGTILKIPVSKTGVYLFLISENENADPVWKQKVFAVAPAEDTLTEETKNTLAEKFAPIVQFHKDEKYSPVSFEYLLNEVDTDQKLQEEPFVLKAKKTKGIFSFFLKPSLNVNFHFKDIRKILPYYGHTDAVLKSGLSDSFQTQLVGRYGESHKTVYYSVFENKKWNEIYINYHFFYSFDPKNSTEEKMAIASHIFDRESITVVLRGTTQDPLSVFFGAHLATQTLAQLNTDDSVIQEWKTGRVFVNWPEVLKNGNHLIAAAALGSHAMYPVSGNYSVMLGQIKILREPAGGGDYIYSAASESQEQFKNSKPYILQSLNLKAVTSDCNNADNILAFSGSTVDVLGPANATFPPFTDREEDYFSYADPNAPMFEMPKK